MPHRRVRRPRPGAVPGAIVAAGTGRTRVQVVSYGPDSFHDVTAASADDCASFLGGHGVVWLDVLDAPDAGTLETLGRLLHLHPLAVADAANVPQRPKHEAYDGFDFLVLRLVRLGPPGTPLDSEQLSIFWGAGWVLTIGEHPSDALNPIRERLRTGSSELRARGADFLAYALLDVVVDNYFPVVESIGDRLEELETRVLGRPDRELLVSIHRLRRELASLRRAVWPLREALSQLVRDGSGRFSPATVPFLRDCYDHAVQIIDLLETYRDHSASLLELHLSAVDLRTNEVMKVLTLIATVFLPLTFITGLYGMNFTPSSPWNLPELRLRYGYPLVLLVMAAIAGAMMLFFRRKGWLGGRSDPVGIEPSPDEKDSPD